MSKFLFGQTTYDTGEKEFFGTALTADKITDWAKSLTSKCGKNGIVNITPLGEAEFDRYEPAVASCQTFQASDAEDPDSADYAIQLNLPAFEGFAAEGLESLCSAADGCVLFWYMEHYVLTDETCALNAPLWEGDSLEGFEAWLVDSYADVKADLKAQEAEEAAAREAEVYEDLGRLGSPEDGSL